jgi:hypothetical protein
MLPINRRRVLSIGLGATMSSAFAMTAWAAPPPGKGKNKLGSGGGTTSPTDPAPTPTLPPPPPPATGILRAVVTIGASSYEVREDQGQDLGNFISEIGGFTQRCTRADVPGLPMTVFFRPDLNSDRVEVVFELGRLFNAAPANLGAYAVAIYRDTQLLATVSVPVHYWFSRWRWQSAPRPVVANIDTLISQGLLPPYHRAAELLATTPQTYSIMGLAGVTAYMPSTGERPDIGMLTEPQAQFVRTSDQNALTTLRAQGEAAGTVPWHMRDENTGAPIDFRTYPNATWYSASAGSPYIASASTPVTIDSAHQPALSYLPYLLTGDPYHLEDLQFQATWNWGALPPQYRPSIPQPRAWAWSVRTLAQCARITPASTPAWLLPQTYWLDQLADHREYFEAHYVNSISPVCSVFRATGNIYAARDEGVRAPAGTWVDPWQDEFLASVLGWINTMGFSDWRMSFDWIIGGTIARTNGVSGWMRAQAVPYRMILRATNTSPFAQTWGEAWQLTKDITGATVIDPNTWYEYDMAYLAYARGSLVFAARLGAPGAAECLAWANGQILSRNWNTAHKWRIGAPT